MIVRLILRSWQRSDQRCHSATCHFYKWLKHLVGILSGKFRFE